MVDPNETAGSSDVSTGARAASPEAARRTSRETSGESSGQWGVGSFVGEGRYRLTGRLGRGGMAEVFAAEDVRLGRIVAVKLLRGDLAEDPVSKARFTREAQAVAGLNHHAVVAVYDSGEDSTATGTVPYIVMELVEGHTIKDLLTGPTPPPVDQALLIVSGVLDALAYSHQHGIVHRDIKPANVIITTGGAVKVMDFGIARALHGAASTMTQTGMVMGTPQYLSPEQALGKSVDHRSDLYATGCLLYELLALRPPFVGETPLSVVYQHVQDEPRLPSQVSDRVPPELDGLVLRALAKQPEDRFQSAEEMRGVVGYAHQALTQQGGWTGGMWNTGAVTAVLPQRSGPGGGTHHPDGRSGSTAELGLPLVPGVVGGTDSKGSGYDDGYGGGHGAGGGQGGNRWLKPVLFAVAAVLAVVLGVYLATKSNGNGGGHTPADTRPPASVEQTDNPPTDSQPSDEPTGEPTDTGEPSSGPTTTPPTPTNKPTTTPPTTPPTSKPPTSKPPTSQPPTSQPPTSKPPTSEPPTPTDTPTDNGN
ncbi:protein kinase domain-containing protein [Actinacidiphila bryophytorum]|uniref:non-specific serine/threonine protein kinase n=1 Tax=Actinacidiphila bryophytorum TaxID=1436133 RepID=A0A9W4MJQ6_9ACTN|nr:protein kinase [Actinacidiphila bryophytorum]MBM9437395.1 serine/threonine protein kinase [Actinacidiphila bryophytorum]MBN6542590.1 serine/threonine protein kinase [Actinacidiphila bryophytorum]CAG7651928.1 Non-specific serine/threonine protein kinase [Actinacidiphila bryophytorum]